MRILILTLLTALHFCSCTKKPDSQPINTVANPIDTIHHQQSGPFNYLALGDSYTIGQSVAPELAYPNQLAAQMTQDGYAVNKPLIIARTGWTTDELIEAINASGQIGHTFDFVTLLIGVNDQFDGLSKDNYRIKFEQVLQTAIAFAGGNKNHVFVLSIPDYGVTPFANGNDAQIGPAIDQFNAINREISVKYNVNYLDITPNSRQAANDLSLIADDGLHPSGKMYAEWVSLLRPMVEGWFKQ